MRLFDVFWEHEKLEDFAFLDLKQNAFRVIPTKNKLERKIG